MEEEEEEEKLLQVIVKNTSFFMHMFFFTKARNIKGEIQLFLTKIAKTHFLSLSNKYINCESSQGLYKIYKCIFEFDLIVKTMLKGTASKWNDFPFAFLHVDHYGRGFWLFIGWKNLFWARLKAWMIGALGELSTYMLWFCLNMRFKGRVLMVYKSEWFTCRPFGTRFFDF